MSDGVSSGEGRESRRATAAACFASRRATVPTAFNPLRYTSSMTTTGMSRNGSFMPSMLDRHGTTRPLPNSVVQLVAQKNGVKTGIFCR